MAGRRVRDVMSATEKANGSGWFEGVRHIYPLRVYYEDTDAAGIVYYANYLRFAERARTEMMRCLGTEHRSLMQSEGVAFAVRRADTKYFLPARLDDPLTVETTVDAVGGASMQLTQTVLGPDGSASAPVRLVQMGVRLACIDAALRPARLPKSVRAALQELVKDQ